MLGALDAPLGFGALGRWLRSPLRQMSTATGESKPALRVPARPDEALASSRVVPIQDARAGSRDATAEGEGANCDSMVAPTQSAEPCGFQTC